MVVTTEADGQVLLRRRRRRLTREQAVLLQRIGRLYQFGLPDLTRPGDSRPLSVFKRIVN